MESLIELFNGAKINYDLYLGSGLKDICKVDYTIIIPGHKRKEYIRPVIESFIKAYRFFPVEMEIIIVEQERNSTYNNLPFPAKYFYVPLAEHKQFNKSLCHNIGALLSQKSKYYIFHDIDTAVPLYFFRFLHENIIEKKADAIQCFNNQRLLHCSESLTKDLLGGLKNINSLSKFSHGINEAVSGAQGGSICVERELFFRSGGFDTFLTGYSVEDAMFFHKINMLSKMYFCDSPQLELFHLWHEPAFNRTTKECDWVYHRAFMQLDPDGKKEFIKIQSEYINQFVK